MILRPRRLLIVMSCRLSEVIAKGKGLVYVSPAAIVLMTQCCKSMRVCRNLATRLGKRPVRQLWINRYGLADGSWRLTLGALVCQQKSRLVFVTESLGSQPNDAD